MPDLEIPKLSFDDFVRVSTNSAIEVLRAQERLGGFRVPPKIWVGIIIDPFGQGPLSGTGGGTGQ